MNDAEHFIEMCPTHKVQVQRMDVRTIVAENGDHLYRYKCPIPRCNFRTIKRLTKEQVERSSKERSEFIRQTFKER